MKKLIFGLAALAAATCMTSTVNAQESGISAGVEIAVPMGDLADSFGFGIGVSGAYEYGVTDNIGITGTIGYSIWTISDDVSDFVDNASMLPIQLGGRYYFDEQGTGFFAGAQVGVHIMMMKTKDIGIGFFSIEGESSSESNLSFAPEVGYFITESISAAARYQIITGDAADGSYLGVRAAYHF